MSAGAQEVPFVRVLRNAGVIAADRATVVTVGRYDVALFNVGGEVRAFENACPHQGGPISEGIIEGATVTCPWHAWCFDLRTGSMTLGDFARLRPFAVSVRDDGVYVSTEPAAQW
jgi:nitrite reductase/ring-hydroxylating ferredoxin subunit